MFMLHERSVYRIVLRLLIMTVFVWVTQPTNGSQLPTKVNLGTEVTSHQSSNTSSMKDVQRRPVQTTQTFLSNVYHEWSEWTPCNKKCQQSRKRTCKKRRHCHKSYIKEKRTCTTIKKCPRNMKKNRIKLLGLRKNGKLVKEILYQILYGVWTSWSVCSRSCKKERRRHCIQSAMCGDSYLQEERPCRKGSLVCRKQYILRTYVPNNEHIDKQTHPLAEEIKKKVMIENKNTTTKTGPSGMSKSSISLLSNMTSSCGRRSPGKNKQLRIVGGDISIKHAWPWQVAILEKLQDQFCGGTLIAPQWVLTAAHCVRKKNRRRRVYVRLGDHSIYDHDKGEVKLKLEKDFPHDQYDFNTITNDIALLKLERPVQPSATIDYACLPDKHDRLEENKVRKSKNKSKTKRKRKAKTMCYIVGWGKEKNTDMFGSSVLRQAQVPLVNRETCQRAFDYPIHKTQICAGSRRGGVDSCAGDSGGPLLCEKVDSSGIKRWVVYGVTSYGEGCGEKRKYGIYTNVRKYIDWINDVIANN